MSNAEKVKTCGAVLGLSEVALVYCTCCRLDFAELFRRDAPHPHRGVSKATRDQA